MGELSKKGYLFKEVSGYLNYHKIKTPKGLNYYPKLAWVSLFMYRRRRKRSFKDKMERVVETLVAVPFGYCNK